MCSGHRGAIIFDKVLSLVSFLLSKVRSLPDKKCFRKNETKTFKAFKKIGA